MDQQFIPFVLSVCAVLLVGFITWTLRAISELRTDNAALKLHVAENYVTNPDLLKLEVHLEKVDNKVNSMLELLYKINARVGAEGAH